MDSTLKSNQNPTDYTIKRQEMLPVFDLVCDKNNWKFPIDAWVPITEDAPTPEMISEAVVFFTGGKPAIKATFRDEVLGYHVTGSGYYIHVGI